MKATARHLCPVAVLSIAFIAVPAFAQDSMQGMDMSHMQHHTNKPAKPTAGTTTARAKETQTHESAVHSMPYMPPPNLTGELEVLDIASQIGVRPVVRGLNLQPMQMDMHGMQMQGGQAPPGARSADYSDGIGYGPMPGMDMMDDTALGMLLIDRLEYFNGRDAHGAALDAQGWYGTDANKLWLKAEGEQAAGRLQTFRGEVLWDHPIAAFWDMQVGVRHDLGLGPDRSWAAFGVQGLAPYWFDVEATAYVGPSGRTALRFEAEYELLLTQRLILQPRIEASLYGRGDPARGIGSGLSEAAFGLRLRYEVTRQLAPYAGLEFRRRFGGSARLARIAGEPAFDARLVAGVRFWF